MIKRYIPLLFLLLFTPLRLFANDSYYRELKLQTPRMNGPDVKALQERLLELGYADVDEADGWFGPMTEKGLKAFQSDFFCIADGIADEVIWENLFKKESRFIKSLIDYRASCDSGDYDAVEEKFDLHDGMVGVTMKSYLSGNRLIKAEVRTVADGSGYKYVLYLNDRGRLVTIDYVWWIYDFETGQEIHPIWEQYFLLENGDYAVKNGHSPEWDIPARPEKREEIEEMVTFLRDKVLFR